MSLGPPQFAQPRAAESEKFVLLVLKSIHLKDVTQIASQPVHPQELDYLLRAPS